MYSTKLKNQKQQQSTLFYTILKLLFIHVILAVIGIKEPVCSAVCGFDHFVNQKYNDIMKSHMQTTFNFYGI